MAKRKEKRRQKRQERRERSLEEREAAREAMEEASPEAVQRADESPVPGAGRSWTGIIGAGLGILAMGGIGLTLLIETSEDVSRWAGVPFLLLAAGFGPALWVSARPSRIRQRVLRATVIGCLLTAFASTFVFTTAAIAVMLMPSSALLAIAAGLIFQGFGRTQAKR